MDQKRPPALIIAWVIIGGTLLCCVACIAVGGHNMLWSALINYEFDTYGSQIGVGEPAPDFALNSTDGQEYRLSFYQGQPVLVHFFTTWCDPCEEEMPTLKSYGKAYPNLAILAVDEGDSKNSVESYIADHKLTFPVVLDPGLKIGRDYSVTAYPTSVFVDARGDVKAVHVGTMSNTDFNHYLSLVGLK